MLRRFLSPILIASVAFAGTVSSHVSASTADQGRSTYIVVFKNGANARSEAAQLRAQGYQVRFTYEHVFPGVAVDLPATAARALENNPRVELVEADAVVTKSTTQTGVTSWGIDRIDETTRLLNKSYTYPDSAGQGVTAYIVDTGIRADHVEFTGRWKQGMTAISDGRGTNDCDGHGTHVAGTVAGSSYGVAKKAWVVPVRVLDCNGSGSWTGVISGLDWIAANATKPAVANMSLGGGISTSVDSAVANLSSKGVTVVVAAGNSTADACNTSPARTPAAVTVGATTSTDAQASYSNFGPCLDIYAPGSSITSSWYSSTTATAVLSGTSMASPHVAGAAALVLGQNSTLTPSQVVAKLLTDSTPGLITSIGSGSPNNLLYVKTPPPVPDVTITTTSLPSATQGTSYTASLSATGGDGVSYSWSASGLPSGLALSGATISGIPTTFGSFTIGLTVTSGGRTASTTLGLSVAQSTVLPVPGSFSKVSPSNGATKISRTPRLTWTTSTNATSYDVCISTTSVCSSWINVGSTTTYTSPLLSGNTTYYWQVRAVNPSGTVTASNGTWSFRTTR